MNEESKPSILLSLPPELWHHIMKSSRRCEALDGVSTWEEHKAGRRTLRNAASAHRILQPYAQEELLRILSVRSEKQVITLVESLKGSSRLAEYAKRMEIIELYYSEDEGEGLNDLLLTTLFEMCCNTKTLYLEHMSMRLSNIAALTKLRYLDAEECRIFVDKPTTHFASLMGLEFERIRLIHEDGNDRDLDLLRSLFSPAQFPALRQISIDNDALDEDPSRFCLLLPQLSHVEFFNVSLSVVALQLPYCTSLKTLRLQNYWSEEPTALMPFFNSLRDLNLVDFLYCDWRDEDGKSSLQDVRSIMAIVGEMTNLKELSLAIAGMNEDSESMMKWREFKGEVRKTCQNNKVKMIRYDDDEETLERHELTWVD